MHLEKFLPWLLIILVIASSIAMEMSAPSLVSIAHYFNAPEKTVALTITLHLLGLFLMSFIYGPLSDIYNRKKVLVFGGVIASIGAVLCVFAPSIWVLIFARLIQGIGTSAPLVISTAVIAENYSPEEADRLFKLNIGAMTVFIAAAPIVGGFINNWFGWHGNYAVAAIIQLIALILLIFFYKEIKVREKIEKSFSDEMKLVMKNYKTAFSSLKFMLAALVPCMLYGLYVSFIIYAAFLYIETFKLSDIGYSIHQGIIVAAFSLVSILFGMVKYNHSTWQRKIIFAGMIAFTFGSIGITMSSTANYTTFFMIILVIGNALVNLTVFSAAMSILDAKGTASSVMSTMRTLIALVFTWFVTTIYNGTNYMIGFFLIAIAIITLPIIAYLLYKTNLFNNDHNLTKEN